MHVIGECWPSRAAEILMPTGRIRRSSALIDSSPARARGASLDIRGGGTKEFYGEAPAASRWSSRELAGISSYEPSELVVTARAGTPLVELEAVLAERGPMLAFEPPRFERAAPSAAWSRGPPGPRARQRGPLRDYVLGVTILDGRGELLTLRRHR